MSGFFCRRVDDTSGVPAKFDPVEYLSFTTWTKGYRGHASNFDVALTWIEASDFHPIKQMPELSVSLLLLGRLYDIDKGCRLDKVLQQMATEYRARGICALYPIDGAGALVLIDHQSDEAFIITDRMGFFPLYVAHMENSRLVRIASHPDVLAASYKDQLPFDEVTMAEFLMTGRSVHPYTYYQPISQLDPGSVYIWGRDGFKKLTVYFEPIPNLDYSSTITELSEELANSIKEAVSIRVENTEGNVGILTSGGLDSRAIIFSGISLGQLLGITFYNVVNTEVVVSQQLTKLAEIEHVLLKRPFEYYGESAMEAVKISGGMWSWSNAHSAGLTSSLGDMRIGLLLTGCYFDYLFKALALDIQWKSFMPKLPKYQQLVSPRYEWYGRFCDIENKNLSEMANARLSSQYSGLLLDKPTAEDRNKIEICRLFPISREVDTAFRGSSLFAVGNYD